MSAVDKQKIQKGIRTHHTWSVLYVYYSMLDKILGFILLLLSKTYWF